MPPARLSGERARTSGQMRLFATLLRRRRGRAYRLRAAAALPCRAPIYGNTARRSARWRYSAPATSRWRSPPRVAIPPPRSPLAARSCSGAQRPYDHRRAERSGDRARPETYGDARGVFNMIFGNRVGADRYNIRRFRPWDSPAHCKVVERSSIWRRDALTPSRSSPKCRASTRS